MKKIIPIFCCVFLTLVLLGCPNEPVEPYIQEFSVYLAKTDTDYTTIHVKQGDTVSKPEDPTRDYYNFLGWVIVTYDENGNAIESPYDFSTPVTTDLWIHAKWEPIQKNVVAASETVNFIENLAIVDEFCQDLHTLVVTGELTLENLDQILTAIYHTDLKINLDLTQTTGLTELKPVEGKDYLFDMGFPSSDRGIYKLSLPKTIKKIDTDILWKTDACRSLYFDGTIADYCAIDFVPCSEIYMEEERIWGHSPFEGFATNEVQIGSVVMKEGMDLVIPEGSTRIDDYAFYYLNPKTVTLPSTLKTVGLEAFQLYDENLQDENEPSIESVKFNGTIQQYAAIDYADIYANPKYYSDTLYINGENISESITLNTDYVGSYAFARLDNLVTLDISNVTSFGEYPFYECNNISGLTCKFENYTFSDIFYPSSNDYEFNYIQVRGESICENAVAYYGTINRLELMVNTIKTDAIASNNIDRIIIGTQCENIEEDAIGGIAKMVGLPADGVNNLSPDSFGGLWLERLEINYSDFEKLAENSYTAFESATGAPVQVMFYAGSVKTFNANLFEYGFRSMSYIFNNSVDFIGSVNNDIYMNSLEDWYNSSFESEYSNPMGSYEVFIKNSNGDYVSFPKTVVIPNGIKKINSYIFAGLGSSYENSFAPTIYLNEVEEIGEGAFWNLGYEIDENGECVYATIYLGEYITEIPEGVFNNGYLETLEFYPVEAFYSDVNVKNLIFNGTVEQFLSIENPTEDVNQVDYNWIQDFNDYCFEDSTLTITGLQETVLEIPEGIKKIYSHQLYYIKNGHKDLDTIILPESLETLCESAFNPADFTNIYYRGSESDWGNVDQKNNITPTKCNYGK